MAKEPDLDAAYALRTPADSLRLYRDWAATYDSGFAARMGYLLPDHVAQAFAAAGGRGPVLDVGAGTGLVAQRLSDRGIGPVDAADISAEMLAVAGQKGLYRALYQVDVTVPIDLAGGYAGIVSAGTFTHGHVGAAALPHLLDLARPGAIVTLSVNLGVWDSAGFDAVLADLAPRIEGLHWHDLPIYAPGADPAHAGDLARILTLTLA